MLLAGMRPGRVLAALACWWAGCAGAAGAAEDAGALLRDLRSGSGRRFVALRRIGELPAEAIRSNRIIYTLLKEVGADRGGNTTIRLRAIELAASLVAAKAPGEKKEAVGIICRILESVSQKAEVRVGCAKALGELCLPEGERDAAAVALLESVLTGGREEAALRLAAARALGRIVQRGPVERAAGLGAVASLVEAVGDGDDEVSAAARSALGVLAGRDLGGKAAAWRGWLDEARRSLAESGAKPEAEGR